VSVGVRSGDTPAAERRRLRTRPPDILITTPESLYLMLTSTVRETLRTVETVIVDEIHSFAGEKRGTHLALSLERLDDLLERPAQRIGLSATVAPPGEIARFLGGVQPVTIMSRPVAKEWDLRLSVPVPDMAALGGANDYGQGLHAPSEYAPLEYAPSEVPGGGTAHSASAGSPQGAAQPISSAVDIPANPPYTLEDAIGVFPGQETGQVNPVRQGDNTAPKNTLTIPEGAQHEVALHEKALRYAPDSERPETSIWPRVQERIVDHIENNRSTIVFVNSRGLAEKLTAALNDIRLGRILAKQGIDPEDYALAETTGEPVAHIAALREAVEETGLDPAGVQILGQLHTLPLPISNFMVTPVIGWWNSPVPVEVVDHNESALIARVPVRDLLNPANRHTAYVKRGRITHKTPAFEVAHSGSDARVEFTVWGFTAIVLDKIFDALTWTVPWDASVLKPAPASG